MNNMAGGAAGQPTFCGGLLNILGGQASSFGMLTVLIEQLRAREEHGLVSRQPSSEDSQGIECWLTLLGESLWPILDSLIEWGAHHAKALDEVHRLSPRDVVVRDRIV